MTPKQTKVALIQMRCGPEPEENFKRAIEFIRDAAKQGAQIVCLPELFRSQYFCQSEDHKNFELAEEIPGRSTSVLEKLAGELGVVVVASLFEKRSAGLYHNTAAIIDADGKFLGKYRKMHIPDDPLYHEKFYFTPGDLGFRAWDTALRQNRRLHLLGPMVSGSGAADGAQRRGNHFLSHGDRLASVGEKEFGEAQHSAWETIQRSHAIANGCYVAVPNRVGHEAPAGGEGIEFWGQSFVAGPDGEIIAKGSVDREEIVMADIDWQRVNEHRTHWPFLRDRRVDAYAGLEKRMID